MTRCSSEEEFIDRFARFTTENDVVVPALPHVTVGTSGQFVIRLKDQSVMMKGRCEVTEIRAVPVVPGAAAPPARALMRLRMREMDAHSAGVHLRLMERHAATSKPPVTPPAAPEPARRPSARLLTLVPPIRDVPPPPPARRDERPVPPPPPASTMQIVSVPGARSLRSAPPPAPARGAASLVQTVIGASAAVAPALPDAESTDLTPLPRAETRAAGAAFTLPANPLSDLDAADLAGFIESTLLEGDGVVGEAPAAAAANVSAEGAPVGPASAAVPATVAAPARKETRGERAVRIARRVAPYAACVIAGLWLGIALRPSAKVAVVVGAPAVVEPPAVDGEPMPPSVPRTPTTGTGTPARSCVARVATTPAGAQVFWGDIALGQSPIEQAAIPCGSGTLKFRRERYAEQTRTITAERGQNVIVEERLSRPPAKLVVTSTPPNAMIKVNRSRFGPAPRRINTLRFEHIRIQASLPGYRPWKKTVYLRDADVKVEAELVPIAKPAPRRASPAAPARPR